MATTDQIVQDLEHFYKRYIDGFNREDIDHFIQSFDLPFVVLSGDHGVTVFADEAAQQTFYTQTMIAIQGRGWTRSAIDQIRIWPLADNLATLMADVTRYKKDDAILERLRAFYTLRHNGKSWKIATVSMATPPFTGPGDLPRA